ncbi:DUF1588 domain-containing protein [Oligoflexus tunisiensis]|uniref:DUF1588 domain-containing protein n=1 Tax=Oligoflexus tunisiensis TaxID=708132 RepID=UPI000AB083D8|nr:DUF1588 domain-containing protein [Oligoflexus tunisiensis]
MSKRIRMIFCLLFFVACHSSYDDFKKGFKQRNTDTTGFVDSSTDRGKVNYPAPKPHHLRKLTNQQYKNSIRDVLGVTISENVLTDQKQDGLISIGSSQATVSPSVVDKLHETSLAVADKFIKSPDLLKYLRCDCKSKQISDECLHEVVKEVGTRLFREPLSKEQIGAYSSLATSAKNILDTDMCEGLKFPIAAMLESPNFLYIKALIDANESKNFSIANFLAFFLWNTGPDQQLIDLARNNKLTDPRILEKQVDRMLASANAHEGIMRYFNEIFDLDRLPGGSSDATADGKAKLQAAMRLEIEHFLKMHLAYGSGDLREILTSPRTMVNGPLSEIYGLSVSGDQFTEVTLPESQKRIGILGKAGLLNMFSHGDRTSPTLRGKFIQETFLCETVPPPPSMDEIEPGEQSEYKTMRERLSIHVSDPTCASCHKTMDPFGLSLEIFDASGKYRSEDNGKPIMTADKIDGIEFSDPMDLAGKLAEFDQTQRCLVNHFARIATGKNLTKTEERRWIEQLAKNLKKNDFKIRSLMKAIALETSQSLLN